MCLEFQGKTNLLGSPYFNYPIMPLGVVYYNFPVHEYMLTHWRFEFNGTYVSFNYPQPKVRGVPQVLFMDDNRQCAFQMFRVAATVQALRVILLYRMPFREINGTIKVFIDSISTLNLTFRNTTRNQIITASNYISNNNRTVKRISIRAYNFQQVIDFNSNRTGYQILTVIIEPAEKEVYIKNKLKKNVENTRKSRKKAKKANLKTSGEQAKSSLASQPSTSSTLSETKN